MIKSLLNGPMDDVLNTGKGELLSITATLVDLSHGPLDLGLVRQCDG